MLYRKDRYGNELSELGFGCLRFTTNALGQFDVDKAEREFLRAHELGVNYYDTAYIYPGNEVLVGEILSRHPGLREEIHIATKLPHYLMKSMGQAESTFAEELKRLRTDYIDYYLMHMVTDIGAWEKMVKMGIVPWIEEKKRSGAIRQIGFSFHGSSDMFLKVLDAYDWDFCQIQYNYMDEYSQAGRRGLKAAAAKGIPVIIMEPLRGGRLINLLPAGAKQIFAAHRHPAEAIVPDGGAAADCVSSAAKSGVPVKTLPDAENAGDMVSWSPAEWGLRWLYDQPGVTVVLSGMNSMEMVEENCRIASVAAPGCLTEEDRKVYETVKEEIGKALRVPCTGCAYCMPCPHGVDIPGAFRAWNEMYTESKKSGRKDYFRASILRHEATSASLCVKCGRCETHCPQSIPIRSKLADAAKDLETPWYKIARTGVKILHLW